MHRTTAATTPVIIGFVRSIDISEITFEFIRYRITTIDEPGVAVQPKGKLAMAWHG